MLHALKTALAAALTWVVYDFSPLPDRTHHVWAVVSAVLVMQSNLGGVLKAAGARGLGTAIGAAFGAAVGAFAGAGVPQIAAAVGLTLAVCAAFGLRESNRLAGSTAAIVLLGTQPGFGPFGTGLLRLSDVLIGMTVAILVQSALWPGRARADLRDALDDFLAKARDLFPVTGPVLEAIVLGPVPIPPADAPERREAARLEMVAANARLRELFADLKREPAADKGEVALWAAVLASADELEHHVEGLIHAHDRLDPAGLSVPMRGPLRDLALWTLTVLDAVRGRVDGVAVATPQDGELEAAIASADAAFERLRREGVTLDYPVQEAVRFCVLFQHLRAAARHLSRLSETLGTGTAPAAVPPKRGPDTSQVVGG